MHFRVIQRVHRFLDMALLAKCSGGANHDTLAAVDTARNVEPLVKSSSDLGAAAAADKIDRRHALDFLADPDTFAAEDTFIRVARDRGVGGIHLVAAFFAGIASLTDTQLGGHVLECAGAVTYAEQAVIRVVSQQKLDNCLAGSDRTCGVCLDFHALGYRERHSSGRGCACLPPRPRTSGRHRWGTGPRDGRGWGP